MAIQSSAKNFKFNMEKHEMYDVLSTTIKKIAHRHKLKSHNLTLQTTEIVHESFIILAKQNARLWKDKNEFLAAFSETIRRFIIDHFRKKGAIKRGGLVQTINIDDIEIEISIPDDFSDWLSLDKKLKQLELIDSISSKIIELRYFMGLSIDETARVVNISPRTVTRKWHFARAWLQREMLN